MPIGHLALTEDPDVSGAEPARDLQVKQDGVADHVRQEALDKKLWRAQNMDFNNNPVCGGTVSLSATASFRRPSPTYHPPHAPRTQGEVKLSNGVERTSRRSPALGRLKYKSIYAFVRFSCLGTPLEVLPQRFASQIV